jgi:hypothetical protein
MSKTTTTATENRVHVQIKPPNMQTAQFVIEGTAPLVIHRFSEKAKKGMLRTMEEGPTSRKGKQREPLNTEEVYNAARYVSKEGWDGFNASSVRCAMIRACSLVGYKMVNAKMSVFVLADGRDATEPEYALVRIIGKPRKFEAVARVETGQAYVTIRPIYDEWKAKLRIRYDGDQFTIQDVANLLARAGESVGIGEGRPCSKNSAGMGWGTFKIVNSNVHEN